MESVQIDTHELPEDWVIAGRYQILMLAHDRSLVVLAMGNSCWVSQSEITGEYELRIEPGNAQAVARELDIYEDEQADQNQFIPQTELVDGFSFPPGWGILLLWIGSLVYVFHLQGVYYDLTDRFASSPIELIDHHEWWRSFTALFFHADLQHLSGNILSGAIFGTLVSRSIGSVLGWSMILACGTIGNIMTSLMNYPEPISSIGASTAVFGALGILAGLGFVASLRLRSRLSWAKVAAPIMAGVILLGWLGGGSPGSNTDVLAHAFGFSTGLICGMITGEIMRRLDQHEAFRRA
jgi:rhomboid protease GluP